MKPDRYVLDTSALFSYMEDEPGSAFVEQVLNDPKSSVLIPWPVLFEVYYTTRRKKARKRRIAAMCWSKNCRPRSSGHSTNRASCRPPGSRPNFRFPLPIPSSRPRPNGSALFSFTRTRNSPPSKGLSGCDPCLIRTDHLHHDSAFSDPYSSPPASQSSHSNGFS